MPGGIQAWARELNNGDIALAVVNMNSTAAARFELGVDTLVCSTCPRSVRSVDVWAPGGPVDHPNATDIPAMAVTTFDNTIVVTALQAHEARFLRLTPQQEEVRSRTRQDM